jgi:hypothetical protein
MYYFNQEFITLESFRYIRTYIYITMTTFRLNFIFFCCNILVVISIKQYVDRGWKKKYAYMSIEIYFHLNTIPAFSENDYQQKPVLCTSGGKLPQTEEYVFVTRRGSHIYRNSLPFATTWVHPRILLESVLLFSLAFCAVMCVLLCCYFVLTCVFWAHY